MPPIQPSLRGSLLTGASAFALSVSGAGASAQSNPGSQTSSALPQWTVWAEGGSFQTAGGPVNIPSIPALGAPFTSLNPLGGIEGAFGFDYRFTNDPLWHFVFDFRYGGSRTVDSNSSSSSSSSSTNFITHGFASGPFLTKIPLTTTIRKATANSTSTQASEWESHLVTDFMIGRDLGIGANRPEIELGLRIADLRASGQISETTNSTTTTTTTATFYSYLSGTSHPTSTNSTSAATSAFGSWNSQFFGFGPRAAITGGVPLVGVWTFDYEAGVAELFGYRTFNFNVTSSTGGSIAINSNPMVAVFNADAWIALSYRFTPYAKLSGGIRTDFYDSALTTYNVNTGGFQNVSRDYWGPFLRLTGTF
jgi:hypothetical protein